MLAGEAWPVEEYWKVLADNGWLGILVPQEYGGSGGTLLDACLVVEVMYRELVPLPFAANAVLVPALLQEMPSEATPNLLAELAAGTRRIALGVDTALGWPGAAVAWEWTAGDFVAVSDGASVRLVEGDAVEPVSAWDLLRPTGRIDPAASVSGSATGAAAARFCDIASVVSSAAIVGLMDGAVNLAVDYARTREQYGRPIGAFQAVQHLCAEMYVDLEAARAAYLGATAMVQTAHPSGRRATAVAKAWCAEAGIRVTQRAVQVLGGIGNTWESDAHLYLRGAHQWGRAFRDLDSALDLVADGLLEPSTGVST